MRPPRTLALASLLLVTAGASLLAPPPAYGGAGNLAARVEGSYQAASGEGRFEGTLAVAAFAREGDRLVARGTVDGTFTDAAGKEVAEATDRAIVLEVDAARLSASCQVVKSVLTPPDLEVSGLKAKLEPVEVEIGANAVPAGRLEGPLCDLAKTVGGGDLDAVAQQLDRVLAALE
jgi:hypothetical protein